MFGIGFFEILIILVVAVIFLGPDKLPQAIVDFVKFFRALKRSINEAKDTLDKELEISKLVSEVEGIKSQFETQVDSITKDIDLGNLQEIKEIKQEINELEGVKDRFQDELGDLGRNVGASDSLFGEYSALPSAKKQTPIKNKKSSPKSSTKSTPKSTTKTTTKSVSKNIAKSSKSTTQKPTTKTTTKTSISQSGKSTKKPSVKSKTMIGAI
ncbi:twin arginine-targeting protein translocase TatB [Helicobacter macacae MIT 99-5501]|uniref:Sec-independent protein translocase protein TatB homolog n=1 Tax=Helicobacter macacae MIT 99-5501 TaxID=1357400 RepID=V8C915_9HELI|nr:twin arginine-targeting protein translocase TatB [Helicobacter macacae MIT 99-5501]